MLHPVLHYFRANDPTAQPQSPIDDIGGHVDTRVNGLGNFSHHLKSDDSRPHFFGGHYLHQIYPQGRFYQPQVLEDRPVIADCRERF
jgi:hypothetical protein